MSVNISKEELKKIQEKYDNFYKYTESYIKRVAVLIDEECPSNVDSKLFYDNFDFVKFSDLIKRCYQCGNTKETLSEFYYDTTGEHINWDGEIL